MKLLTYILSFAYLFTLSPLHAGNVNQSKIAAIVNEKSILTSDLDSRVKLVAKSAGIEMSPDTKKQLVERVLKQMIDEELQKQIVQKVDMTPTKSELKDAWHRMEKNFGMAEGELDKQLQKEKIPRRVLEEQIKANLGWQNYIHERYRNLIQVSSTDVKNEMNRIKADKDRDQALLSEIVLYYDKPEKASETKAKADKLAAKLRSGASFPLMAQQFSHSASAASGGDIGWVSLEQLDPKLKNTVSCLDKGDVSDPVPVKDGFCVMGMRDRQGVGSLGKPIEYISVQQVEFLFPMFGGDEAKEETYIQAKSTAQQAKTCSMLKKLTTDRPRIKAQFVEKQRTENLHPELAKVLKTLKPGEKSPLLNTGQGLLMFMLCDRNVVQPHEPGEKEIRNTLLEKKLTQISEREMRNLRRAAHIDRKI